MTIAEIHLPYYKQGDDLAHHLQHSKSVLDALEGHAQQMDHAGNVLRTIKNIIGGHDVKFEADTHMIQVSGPDDIIDKLIAEGLASASSWDEDDEAGYEDDAAKGWDAVF